jgi:spoIIIJ-associated protein
MRSVEVEGDNIDDAIQKALVELGITRDRAAIEILNDASRGILGFGGRKARVRATVRAPLSAALAALEEGEAVRVSRETPATGIPPGRAPREVRGEPGRRVSRETSSGRGLATNIAPPRAMPPTSTAVVTAPPLPETELAARARETLLAMLAHLGVIDCEVSCEPPAHGAAASLSICGQSSAILIGKRGQTLDAIEYLLNRMLIRDAGSTSRIDVDVEGYRARREENLVSLARRMADKVRQMGRPASMDPMSPRDRRVVHMALKDEGGVTSRSQGEGFLRKLIILPAGRRHSGARPTRDSE